MAVAFITVASGSVGATLLATSLMSADVPEMATEVADVAVTEAQAAEPAVIAAQESPKTEVAVAAAPVTADIPSANSQPVEAAAHASPAAVKPGQLQEDVAALESTDPRWAQFSKPAPPIEELRNDGENGDVSAFGAAGKTGGALDAVKRAIQEPDADPGQDEQETAAISPPPRDTGKKADNGGNQVVLNTSANIRSRANKTGRVLGAVPAGVAVASYGCRSSWCEISYKGMRGWVYSGFVGGNAAKNDGGRSKPKATQASGQRQKLQVTPSAASKSATGLPGVATGEPLPTLPKLDKSGK